MFQKTTPLVTAVFLLALGAGCKTDESPKQVILDTTQIETGQPQTPLGTKLRIAVGGMVTPKEGFSYYRKLLDYIGEEMKMPVKFVDRHNYAEINNLLRRGDVDVAFVCGGPYVEGFKEFDLKLLVAPVAYGGTVYHSYIIVPQTSQAENIMDLRGKSFAFTDPLSNTGKLVPTYMLARRSETPSLFFDKIHFTYAHDKSIEAVAEGVVDGAAVDSLIWEFINDSNPQVTKKTKIIEKSPPFGIPPVVVCPKLAPERVSAIKKVFLNIHREEKGRAILKGMKIDRFIEINDSAYDSIREMKNWIETRDDAV